LLDGWKEDAEIENLFYTKDEKLIERSNQLMVKVNEREAKIGLISGHMHRELNNMDKYLNKMVKTAEKQQEEIETNKLEIKMNE
jgi:hypothetical protein